MQKWIWFANLEGPAGFFLWCRFCAAFKIMLPTEGGEHFLQKLYKISKKRVCRGRKRQQNTRSDTKFPKLPVWCIHLFLLAGLWGRKMHGTAARRIILKGAWSEKNAKRTAKRAITANKIPKSTPSAWGVPHPPHLSKIYRTSIENRLNIYRKSIEHPSKIYRTSIEHVSNIYRTFIEHRSKIDRKSIEHLSKIYRKSIENLTNIYQKTIEDL